MMYLDSINLKYIHMKKYMFLILIPVFITCGRPAREKALELQALNDSLIELAERNDVEIHEFVTSVDEIQNILDSIKIKENIIDQNTLRMGEMGGSSREKIKNDIRHIYAMILKDKNDLDVLSKKLQSSGIKIKEFQKLVDRLQKEITQKNSDIETLQRTLEKMNVTIASANQQIDTLNYVVQEQNWQIYTKNKTIAEQTTAINTAYYIMGTSKELKEKGIIKKGKILPDFDRSSFTEVDITKTTEIPLHYTKVKVLSNHPTSSFWINQEVSLKVKDYVAFWSNTRYLVLETNKPVSK